MVYFLSAIAVIIISINFTSFSSTNFIDYNKCKLEAGDLVFFSLPEDMDAKGFTKAVSSSGKKSPAYHVAMIVDKGTNGYEVIHASASSGVIKGNLEKLVHSQISQSQITFRRVNTSDEIKEKAVQFAYKALGTEYNDLFSQNNVNSNGKLSYYCSQLVEQAYNSASKNIIFATHLLNFNDKQGNLIEYWQKYYEEKGHDIPFEDYGTQPSSMLSDKSVLEVDECT